MLSGQNCHKAVSFGRISTHLLRQYKRIRRIYFEKSECKISYSPLGVSCITLEDKSGNTIYLDKNGNSITKEQYTEVCEGGTPTEPDVPDTPNTGNPIPYIAVGGGLVALAGVYFYSRKSNKMYKI